MINPIIQQFEELDLLSKEIIKQQVESKLTLPQRQEHGSSNRASPKRQKQHSVRSKGSKENSSKSNQNFGIKVENSNRQSSNQSRKSR